MNMSDDFDLNEKLEELAPKATDLVSIVFSQIHSVRETLLGVERYLYADDAANSQRAMLASVIPSPLTLRVQDALSLVDGVISEHLISRYSARVQAEPLPEVAEQLPDLHDNPLGSMTTSIRVARTVDDLGDHQVGLP